MASTFSNRNIQDLAKESQRAKKNLVHYFSPVDKGSSMPSWYYKVQMDEQEEWLRVNERQLKEGLIPQEKVMLTKEEIAKRKDRLKEIREARRVVEEMILKDKDKSKKRYDELSETLADSYFTRDEMFHKPSRMVDPRMEAERSRERNDIVKEWKIIGAVLGETTNPEHLRKGH